MVAGRASAMNILPKRAFVLVSFHLWWYYKGCHTHKGYRCKLAIFILYRYQKSLSLPSEGDVDESG